MIKFQTKSFKIFILVIVYLLSNIVCDLCYAAELGSSLQTLENKKYDIGIGYKYLFEKDLVDSNKIESYNAEYLKLAYGVENYANLHFRLGTANMNTQIMNAGALYDEGYSHGFLWGLGVSQSYDFLWGEDIWFVGYDLGYNAWKGDFDSVAREGVGGSNLQGDISVDELALTTFLGRDFYFWWDLDEVKVTPYVGLEASYLEINRNDLRFEISGTDYLSKGSTHSDDYFGILVGSNFEFNDKWSTNIEARFLSETSVGISGRIKF